MNKFVVGQFSESFPPLMDGVGFVTKNYTELLLAKGHKAYAIVSGTPTKKGYAQDHRLGIDYTIRATMVPLPRIRPYGLIVKGRHFKERVEEIDFDLIHTHAPFTLGSYGRKLAQEHNIPLVATFHSLYKDDFIASLGFKRLANFLIKIVVARFEKADEVWTPSLWSKERLREYGFKGTIVVVANGCDFPLPTTAEYLEYQMRGREIVKIDSTTPLLLYVGQINEKKNLQLILDSLLLAHKARLDYKMVFVGDGADLLKYRLFVKTNRLEEKIIFLGKVGERETIKALMAAAILFPFPSQYDVSPLVLREAAAFSLPLLNTKDSATAFVTTDRVNGFITENTLASFSKSLIELIGNQPLCKEVGEKARETLYISWDEVINEVDERYTNLINKYRRSQNHTDGKGSPQG